jgi:ornithine decarboxylase
MQIPRPSLDRAIAEFGTPLFLIDVGQIRNELAAFRRAFPATRTFYSTKTNPHPIVIDTATALGMEFDAASSAEIAMLLDRGVSPAAIVFTHPRKTETEIEYAYRVGVRGFVFDCHREMTKLSALAPSADLFLRVAAEQHESVYDYRGRFGATIGDARLILTSAAHHGHLIGGVAFHVGTQTLSLRAWHEAMESIVPLFDEFCDRLPHFRRVNIGSGFPFDYGGFGLITSREVAATVRRHMSTRRDLELAAEPGRTLVASAVQLVTRVEDITSRDGRRWVSVDASVYQGLTEILQSGGRVRYQIGVVDRHDRAPADAVEVRHMSACTVVGKTLDPDDILGEDVLLPDDLAEGDCLVIHDVGAYSVPFITDYHMLRRPVVASVDSADDSRVVLGPVTATEWGVFARRTFAEGERVMSVFGHRTREPTCSTLELDGGSHVEPTVVARHLNHSCDPNAHVRQRADGFLDIIAKETVLAGEEIVVDDVAAHLEGGTSGRGFSNHQGAAGTASTGAGVARRATRLSLRQP